ITALLEAPLAAFPLVLTLTRMVLEVAKSRRNTSGALLVSSGTRLLALLSRRAKRPSAEIADGVESPFPGPLPCKLTLTSTVVLLRRSRRKTFKRAGNHSGKALVPPLVTRLFAELAKRR